METPDLRNIDLFYSIYKVDDDFDAAFYAKEYPTIINFYQPYCINNNISDQHRLFFHWYMYGKHDGMHKNENEKEKFFTPRIDIREKKENKLAIITTFFNPCNYINLQYNYLKFSENIKQYADLFAIELSFNNNYFIKDSNTIRINGYKKNILWQKEILLNILLDSIPKEYTDIAWIDSDIIFTDKFWKIRLFDELSRYKVVQLFSIAQRLCHDDKQYSKIMSRVKYHSYGAPGFAWAARREVIDEIKFLDNQVLGGGDCVMCSSFMNLPIMLDQMKYYVNNNYTKQWINKTSAIVDRSVSFIDNEIIHLYHGSEQNRDYQGRYEKIKQEIENNFIIENNIWSSKNEQTTEKIYQYFISRKEDDNIIKINNLFDKVYLLNLDREMSKLETVSKKLDFYNIDYQKFSAIDGNLLEYNQDKYEIHKGLLENKYALGCYLSHIEIMKDAKKHKYEKILILEDDVMFCKDFNVKLQSIRSLKNWKMLYLGGTQYDWDNIEYRENFYYANRTAGTFAYAIHNSLYDEIINSIDFKHAIDKNYTHLQKKYKNNCYVCYPNLCIADVTTSSIRNGRDQNKHNAIMRWNIYEYK